MLRFGATIVVAAWLLGEVVSDRWLWSQFLLWIPTLVAIIAGVIGTIGWWRWSRIRWGWLMMTIGIGMWFGLVEHRLLRPPSGETPALRVMHWTMSHGKRHVEKSDHIDPIIAFDADLTLLSNAGGFPRDERMQAWLGQDYDYPPRAGTFTVLTRLPIREFRLLIASDGIEVALLIIEANERLDRPLTILLVDLPSHPLIPRMETAETLRRHLDDVEVPNIDLVIGDFNMPRRGVALTTCFPGMRHAYDDAGSGYGATFNRRWPIALYHIDHTLVGTSIEVCDYRLADPDVGRHRVQLIGIR